MCVEQGRLREDEQTFMGKDWNARNRTRKAGLNGHCDKRAKNTVNAVKNNKGLNRKSEVQRK